MLRGQSLGAQIQMLTPSSRAPVQRSEPNRSMPDGSASDGSASYPPPAEAPGMCPAPPEGSATILGESGDTEYGFTDRGTPDIVQLLQNNPTASVDEVLRTLGDQQFQINYQSDPNFPQTGLHPSIASYGRQAPAPNQSSAAGKRGVLVANAQYTAINPLPQVTAQATSLQSQLAGRGFAIDMVNNATAATMGARYDQMVNGAAPGDELVGFFTGHGSPDGMCGINYSAATRDLYGNGQVARLLSAATSRGAHIRFIIDACHSGAAATTVREERANQLAQQADTVGQAAWMALAQSAMTLKRQLVAHSNARAAALRQFAAARAGLVRNPLQPAAAQTAALAALDNARAQVQQAFDRKADQTWGAARGLLSLAAFGLNLTRGTRLSAPERIGDYARLGNVIDFLDSLANAAMAPVEQARERRHVDRG